MLIIQYWIFKNYIFAPAFLYGKVENLKLENEKVQAV